MPIASEFKMNDCSTKGFTLIEMAVVLFIVALILGVIFSGQFNLIESGQTQDAMAIASDLSTATRDFKSRYHYLPGDFPINQLNPEIPNVTTNCMTGGIDVGDGNGLITIALTSHPDESICVPEHLFKAGYIKGGGGSFKTAYGNVRVIAKANSSISAATFTSNVRFKNIQNVIEFANLPCDVVNRIDQNLDDANLATGNIMASVATCVSGATVPFVVMGL